MKIAFKVSGLAMAIIAAGISVNTYSLTTVTPEDMDGQQVVDLRNITISGEEVTNFGNRLNIQNIHRMHNLLPAFTGEVYPIDDEELGDFILELIGQRRPQFRDPGTIPVGPGVDPRTDPHNPNGPVNPYANTTDDCTQGCSTGTDNGDSGSAGTEETDNTEDTDNTADADQNEKNDTGNNSDNNDADNANDQEENNQNDNTGQETHAGSENSDVEESSSGINLNLTGMVITHFAVTMSKIWSVTGSILESFGEDALEGYERNQTGAFDAGFNRLKNEINPEWLEQETVRFMNEQVRENGGTFTLKKNEDGETESVWQINPSHSDRRSFEGMENINPWLDNGAGINGMMPEFSAFGSFTDRYTLNGMIGPNAQPGVFGNYLKHGVFGDQPMGISLRELGQRAAGMGIGDRITFGDMLSDPLVGPVLLTQSVSGFVDMTALGDSSLVQLTGMIMQIDQFVSMFPQYLDMTLPDLMNHSDIVDSFKDLELGQLWQEAVYRDFRVHLEAFCNEPSNQLAAACLKQTSPGLINPGLVLPVNPVPGHSAGNGTQIPLAPGSSLPDDAPVIPPAITVPITTVPVTPVQVETGNPSWVLPLPSGSLLGEHLCNNGRCEFGQIERRF